MQSKQTESKAEQQKASDTRFGRQMKSLVEFAREYPVELSKRKFGPDKIEAMAMELLRYQGHHDEYLAARGHRVQLTRRVNEVRAEIMSYRHELSVAQRLLEKHGGPAAPPIRKRTSFGDSARRCLAWMTESRSGIASMADPLSATMDRPLARFDELRSSLSAAMSAQQHVGGAELTRRRKALAMSRAELLRLAELLRFAGRFAFKGQPSVLKRLRHYPGAQRRKQVAPPAPTIAIAA